MHNLNKMMKKINETDPEFIANYHKYKEIHRREKQSQLLDKRNKVFKDYGGIIRNPGYKDIDTGWKPLFITDRDEYDRYLEDELGVDPKKPKLPKYY